MIREASARTGTLPTAARDMMRFHLVYNGPLRASASSPKPQDIMAIRMALAPQMKHLWETHNALQILSHTGAKQVSGGAIVAPLSPRQLAQRQPGMFEDCLAPISVGEQYYLPLVRQSLDLNCELQVLFLRQQNPGELISQGGDIDNRVKTLLDALRMPSKDEQDRAPPVDAQQFIFCLMESDTLVSRLDVDTDRLLFPQTDKANEVHLVIQVSLNVLRVGPYNMCLL